MKDNVLDLINSNYDSFSKSNKKIAKYILKNYDLIPFKNLSELKSDIGVSESTISRFSRILGYNNFNMFQKEFEQFSRKRSRSFEELQNTFKAGDENLLFEEIENSNETLKELYSDELNERIKEASNLLKKSRNIIILGSRTSKSSALFLYYMLREFTGNVFFLENSNDDISFKINNINENDVLIAISYPKYTKLTYKLLQYFKSKEAKIITITDSKASPFSKLSNIIIEARNSSKTFTIISTVVVINALVHYFANIDKEKSKQFFDCHNSLSKKLDLYLEDIEDLE